jgi:hypothetical protein
MNPPHRRIALLWMAALVAVSPVLSELARSLFEIDGSPSILLAPGLVALLAWRAGLPRGDRHPTGALLAGLGLVLVWAGLFAEIPSLARLGLPAVAVGTALATGWPAFPVALLACWMVPPPTSVLVQFSPWLEAAVAGVAASPLHAMGLAVEPSGPVIRVGAERVELTAFQSGIPMAMLLAELAWYAVLRRGRAFWRGVATAAGCALLALPVQVAVALVAIAVLAAAEPRSARLWLDFGGPLTVAVAGLAWIEWSASRRADPGSAP